MATQTAAPAGKAPTIPVTTSSKPRSSDRLVAWFNAHRQLSYWVGAVVAVAVVLFVWQLSTKRRSEDIASSKLQGARYAFENQNLPLAASELARIVEDYSGTNAASEGRLLLANVRLLQGQPQQVIAVLGDWAPGAGRAFRAQAYGLLGGAYENMGRFREAGQAYEDGSAAARLDFLKAQMLSDAGRAWTFAPDTAKAIAVYRRIVKDFPKEGTATEAKVRLGELTKGAVS